MAQDMDVQHAELHEHAVIQRAKDHRQGVGKMMLSRRYLTAFAAAITLAAFATGREAKARSCLDDTVKSKASPS